MNQTLRRLRGPALALALLILVALQFALLALLIHQSSAPRVDTSFGGAAVDISADRAWTLQPGQCATVRWDLEGIQSVYINGEGKVGQDEMLFCPTPRRMHLRFEITAGSGDARDFNFVIHSLPAAIQAWLLMLGLVLPLPIAGYYFATMWPDRRPSSLLTLLLLLAAALLAGLHLQAAQPDLITNTLDQADSIFKTRAWQSLGFALAGVIYLPLAGNALRSGLQRGSRADIIAIGAFALVLLLLTQAGLESIPHWEIWKNQAFFEGRPTQGEHELSVRFWLLAPHALATTISPNAFTGYHVVNFFQFWGILSLFYGILRQLRVPGWLAFLATILLLFYPVYADLTSIRAITISFNRLSFLTAVYLALAYHENPSRLRLLGLWLALLLNVGTYEIGLAMLLVCPLLWWLPTPRRIWRNINLTAIWYLAPIAKAAHVLLLLLHNRSFYGAGFISGPDASNQISPEKTGDYVDRIANIYRQAFVDGWGEAVNAISQNSWAAPTIVTLALISVTAALLVREATPDETFPRPKQIAGAAAAGFLLVLPAIGILMWFGFYASDAKQIYSYVPIGAAIAVLGLLALATAFIERPRLRHTIIVACSMLLIWSGLSRLYLQQWRHHVKADAKARVFQQIVEQAPAFEYGAFLMLFTTMQTDELADRGIAELQYEMFDSAIYMLYQERRPLATTLCTYARNCTSFDTILQYTDRDFLDDPEDYRDVVIFQLHEDLRVELLRELPPELRERAVNRYDPERLIDFSAPVPPRARSLLGAAWRD